MLGYLRFGGGLPHYRLTDAERSGRAPAGSTQWELMAKAGPAWNRQEALITLAAQGHLIHNDDTPCGAEPGQSRSAEGAAAEGKERTGIFTTSLLAEVAGHRIACSLVSGRKRLISEAARDAEGGSGTANG